MPCLADSQPSAGSWYVRHMLARFGFSRNFLGNPVTWVAAALLFVALAAAAQAERGWGETCAAIAPVVVIAPRIYDEYFVQPLENTTYENCLGRIPAEWRDHWPLTDCRLGHKPYFSGGEIAAFPQKCRFDTGVRQVF